LLNVGRPSDAEMNVIAALAKDSDVTVRRAIYIQAYGHARLAERIAFAGLDEPDPVCRRSALQGVGQVRSLKSADELLKVLHIREVDADQSAREAAMGAIGNLVQGVQGNRVTIDETVFDQLLATTKAKEAMRRRHAIELLGAFVSPFDKPRTEAALTAAKLLTQDEDPATREAAAAVAQRLSQATP
jgi:hypothetical protein